MIIVKKSLIRREREGILKLVVEIKLLKLSGYKVKQEIWTLTFKKYGKMSFYVEWLKGRSITSIGIEVKSYCQLFPISNLPNV